MRISDWSSDVCSSDLLNDKIKDVFRGAVLEMVAFPAGPWDVPDEIGDGRPLLVVMAQDACTVGAIVETVPDLVARIYERKGSDGASLRLLRNNLVFVVAAEAKSDAMRKHMLPRSAEGRRVGKEWG